MDLSLAVPKVILLTPLLLFIALLNYFFLGSPIFFKQLRPGLNGKIFELIKFRTMKEVRGSAEFTASDAQRLTRYGRLLRSTSLDELPSLWNVIKGDMSLVGPRPLLVEYLALYSLQQGRRHDVRPGITGWAQINGRNAISWEEKFAADVWYVDNQSFLLDMRILARTVKRVLMREGVSADGNATMPRFTGSKYEN